MIAFAALLAGQVAFGASKSRSSVVQVQQLTRHPNLIIPTIHSGQFEEQFGLWMESQYGPQWSPRMNERLVNDHRRIFFVRQSIGLRLMGFN